MDFSSVPNSAALAVSAGRHAINADPTVIVLMHCPPLIHLPLDWKPFARASKVARGAGRRRGIAGDARGARLPLFDRIGRRLFLTTKGEQLLADCREVLGQIGSLGERIELIKRGDSGVLKLAAPPQTIESVLSRFLQQYAKTFPNVRVKLTEALGMDQVPLLERGEVHIGIRHDQGENPSLESLALPSDDVLAACCPSLQLGRDGMVDIVSLASHPLLLLDSGYSVRRLFNAACRVADVEPNILLESRAPHTLLALAEAGQGVAIIPSVLRTDRYRLKIVRITHRRKPLRDRYVIQWDKRRPMPSYAQNFCTALAEYMRDVLPITRPSQGSGPSALSASGPSRRSPGFIGRALSKGNRSAPRNRQGSRP